ncbi:Fe-S oxidoreductase [Naumannella cuiyingiana]|uniref:Fe-S oxidoreductase n=1 Tax=Naumannella cuiyingiana TaxID=1347891 RepID=A0A7Z0D8D8_9ACTN|nr:Fe-S oxidoreductase [Naumannella cuiyingiana]
MTIVAIVLALLFTVVGVALFVRGVARIVEVVKLGQPTLGRSNNPTQRWATMFAETLLHTRMLQWRAVGIAHWIVFFGFIILFTTLVAAYVQLFIPSFALPIIGHFPPYEWVIELLAWATVFAIAYLMILRLFRQPPGRASRFFGSRRWMAVFVECVILAVAVCILTLRALEFQLLRHEDPALASPLHFPLTFFLIPGELSEQAAATGVVWVAAVKIVISMIWFCVIGLNLTMGVAWHRFGAWPNIWFRRYPDGKPALGALQPINVGGKPLDFEQIEDLDEDAAIGVGKVEDFTWKDLLDFTSCTECGRCQSQCPAWNTEKPLSPKLLIMGLREHTYEKAPWLQAAEDQRDALPDGAKIAGERALVGANPSGALTAAQTAHAGPIQAGEDGAVGVIDPDVLWSCTTCGACVQQCPVDIEHIDHIVDMRRNQVLMESDFPSELNQLYKGLESKGNPWNMNARKRMEWAKGLEFDVPVVGEDVEDLTDVEYLFWVGCAGAYEDRAIKTTQAVAELLHTAGVKYAVLGNGETCTGDPARRSGNEFVFQQLAMENAETLKEAKASKVVTTCAHCLNTLKNEYPQVGVELEVVHHSQLLNRLVRDGKLTPVAPTEGSVAGRSITYHDPCYIGRHNGIYDPPRDLLQGIPGTTFTEMPRHGKTSFCCGAGGARMWMEEKIGTRVNLNRTDEALATLGVMDNGPTGAVANAEPAEQPEGVDRADEPKGPVKPAGRGAIATGCPFCRVMLSDGLTAKQADGVGEDIEVLDVAQLLLESVKRG